MTIPTIAQLQSILDTHETFKNSYFWSPPGSAGMRRAYEKHNSIEPLGFEYAGDRYEITQTVTCSCKNIYYEFSIHRRGIKKDIRTLRMLIKDIHHAGY